MKGYIVHFVPKGDRNPKILKKIGGFLYRESLMCIREDYIPLLSIDTRLKKELFTLQRGTHRTSMIIRSIHVLFYVNIVFFY
jgi:hypothetical protein